MFVKSFFVNRSVALIMAAVIIAPIASIAMAQADAPRAVVDRYVTAQRRLDWKVVATCVSPAELSEFKKLFRSILDVIPGPIDTTIFRPSSFGKRTSAEIASADSVNYFAGIFATIFDLYPVMREMAANGSDTVLGSVNEGSEMMHFVCRVNVPMQKERISNIEVITLRKTNGKWYVVIKRSMEQMASLMRRSIK